MRIFVFFLMSICFACLLAPSGRAAQLNLATLSCDKYENEIVGSAEAGQSSAEGAPKGPTLAAAAPPRPDAINTVMWLSGFSVAKAGDHVMYGDALASFGFALDAECKNNPSVSLLKAISAVKMDTKNPMDLNSVECATWEARHLDMAKSDAESADTI